MLEARIRNISLLSSVKRAYCSVNKISLEGPNNSFLPIIYNKNPRNLERLRIAPKPSGYVLDKKLVNYWHRYSLFSRLKNYYLLAIVSKRHMMTIHCAKLKKPILNSPCLVVEFNLFQCQEKNLISCQLFIIFVNQNASLYFHLFYSVFRLVIEKSNKHWNAYIEHFESGKVVSASTEEWAIKQFLRSTSDIKAAATIGKVLAQRCLECGLLEVHSDYSLDQVSPKVSFIKLKKKSLI